MARITTTRRGVTALVVGIAALGAGGAAYAATQQTPAQQSAAIATDAATRLGVSSATLTGAIKAAIGDQIDASLKAGTITAAQATAAKARLADANAPLFGPGPGMRGDHRGGPGGPGGPGGGQLEAAAAKYIGITPAALRTEMGTTKSLADVTKAHGKDVAGLKASLSVGAPAGLIAHLDEEINEVHNGQGHDGPPPAGAPAPAAPTN